ncbi:VOC family protein [Streptomyces niveiscabiei]|uniref:VOC family protein n=1 Tax=Streptomyces niveiscabiei TaxID=164115 RepID=UPI0029ABA10C|nr:VOC family protein [Streptomyces niveiscabiei]MDX3384313.1 VOC family protein [Streptomyces niveiscabiei]
MSVELNHTIVAARDQHESAHFLAHVLGLEVSPQLGPFLPVNTANGVSLDFLTVPEESITTQHYAFLVSDEEFDAAFARIEEAKIEYFDDPHLRRPGRINHYYGGRGVYFLDPSGHAMEIITRPYTNEQ